MSGQSRAQMPPPTRPAGVPPVPVGPAPAPPSEADVELLGLGVVSTVFQRMSVAERRRVLAFLTDRYGEVRS